MYTSESRLFSKEFETKAKAAIARQIEAFKGYSVEVFGKAMREAYGANQVKEYGYRWKDVDQCYQAMIMRFGQKMFQERGPGFMTEGEAKSIERMHFGSEYLFEISAAEGVRGAADCDHWYMFEKDWG